MVQSIREGLQLCGERIFDRVIVEKEEIEKPPSCAGSGWLFFWIIQNVTLFYIELAKILQS